MTERSTDNGNTGNLRSVVHRRMVYRHVVVSLVWVIAVAIFLKAETIFYTLPKQYVNEYKCTAAIERFHEQWGTADKPVAIVIGYKCVRILAA